MPTSEAADMASRVVESGSRYARLWVRDEVTSRPERANQLRVGQVASAADPDQAGRLRPHRMTELESGRVVIRGNTNRRDDSSTGVWMHEDGVGRMLGTATDLVLVIPASADYRVAPVGESSDGGRVDGGRTRAGGTDRVTRSVHRCPSRGRRLGGSRRLPHAFDANPAGPTRTR